MKYYNSKARQAGMTLIELTVVLLVLIGLAGLLIPYVSGFVTKTHDSTGSSNIQAVNNAIQRYAVEHYDNYPDKLDSLIEGTTIFTKMMSSQMGPQYLKPLTLNSNQAASLTSVGINTLKQMDSTTGDATFDNVAASDFTVAANTVVAEIDTTQITNLSAVMGKPLDTANNHYVVFGLGEDSTIAGQTLSDVPVHFSKNANMGANKAYNHFVLVFQIPGSAYCDTANAMIMPGADNTVGVTVADLNTAVSAFGTTPASQADCDTIAGNAKSTVGGNGADDVITLSFISPSGKAKFIGSAMAMGKGHFEGLGGALNRYYTNTATN